MNENLNLVEILKDCPKGTKLYSTVMGEVTLEKIDDDIYYPITVKSLDDLIEDFTSDGKMFIYYDKGECLLFPSKDQRDWSKFKIEQSEQPKKEEWCESQEITKLAHISDSLPKQSKFDPNTLKPFDKVLVRNSFDDVWYCNFFSHCHSNGYAHIDGGIYSYCIPYNEDTKHLVGTAEEAPEYYRY